MKIDYKQLIRDLDTYTNEICRVFDKLHNEDMKAKTNIIQYGASAYFERVEWDESDENDVCVRYYDRYYDLYDSSTIKIPSSILFNTEEIDRWIQSLISDKLKEIEECKRKVELKNEAKERAEYERLKVKFGN